jgi:xanthine dehydrogenase molybdenum-binding subunit
MPNIMVKMVEVEDPLGPYGAKGVGEIGNIPTAGAVANALFRYDNIVRYELPMKKQQNRSTVQGSKVQGSKVQ